MNATLRDWDGSHAIELEVEEGSHIFIKHGDGAEEFFVEWEDAPAEVREKCLGAMRSIEGAFKVGAGLRLS